MISGWARPSSARSSALSARCAKESTHDQAPRRHLRRPDDAVRRGRRLDGRDQGQRPQAQRDRPRRLPRPRLDRRKRLSTGRAESLALVDAVLEAAAPGKKVLVGTARESTRGTIEFTNSLPAHGISAVLVRPPSYFKSKLTREALKAHYLAVAEGSRLPVLVYNMPQNTGISLEPRLIVDLAPHPNIIGLKESSGSIAFLEEVVRRVPDRFHYFLGSGHVVYPGLEMGADGAILAVANAAPEMCAEIFRLYQAGKKDEARELQLDLVPLNKALMETYGIAGLKHAQDLRGYHGGPTRLPCFP
ncbi:MAG: dihydrodipicolinate synthase family protein [Candidatus Moduliflexus flocculans]|nr:dihydrodipicolinate synthase family protein [Candidatus Moduliflexus flocculans]